MYESNKNDKSLRNRSTSILEKKHPNHTLNSERLKLPRSPFRNSTMKEDDDGWYKLAVDDSIETGE